jgi:osmotically inducible protein OsmC
LLLKGLIVIEKNSWAVWKGGIKDGGGVISTETGVLKEAPYGFNSRFEGGKGTNPEELIGAAHAGCFSMALAMMLGEAGLSVERIETHATVALDKVGGAFAIVSSHLTVVAVVPGANAAQFAQIADQAKTGCPVSKLLNAIITMDARLDSQDDSAAVRRSAPRAALGL